MFVDTFMALYKKREHLQQQKLFLNNCHIICLFVPTQFFKMVLMRSENIFTQLPHIIQTSLGEMCHTQVFLTEDSD